MKKATILLSLLLSAVVLTACGSKESGWSPSSSSSPSSSQTVSSSTSPSSQVSKPSSSSSQASTSSQSSVVPSETEASSSESSVAEEATQAESSVAEQEAPETPTNYASDFDLDALVAGDYTSLVGTWANAKGTVFTIRPDGELDYGSLGSENELVKITKLVHSSNGRVGGGVGVYKDGEPMGGASFVVVPAGVENSIGLVSEFDHIEIGQSVEACYPEQHYYRQ